MDKIPEEHNPMEEVVQDLLTYLRHQQTEVRKKALEALFSYSGDPTVQRAIQHQDFVKAIKACLYDVVIAPIHVETGAYHPSAASERQRRERYRKGLRGSQHGRQSHADHRQRHENHEQGGPDPQEAPHGRSWRY